MQPLESTVPEERSRPEELRGLVRDATDWTAAGVGRVALLAAPLGLGKTRIVLEELRALGDGSVIIAQSHRLLDEKQREAASLGVSSVRRPRGVLSVLRDEGTPVCRQAHKLAPWASQLKIRQDVCPECIHRANYARTGQPCAAYARARGKGPSLETYAHAALVRENDDDRRRAPKGPTYVDEMPPLIRTSTLDLDELGALDRVHPDAALAAWCTRRQAAGRVIRDAARRLLAPDLARQATSRKDGQPVARHTRRIIARDLREALRDAAGGDAALDALRADLEAAHADEPHPPPLTPQQLLRGVTPREHPRADLDEVLLTVLREGTPDARLGSTACVAIGRPPWPPRPTPRLDDRVINDAGEDDDDDDRGVAPVGIWAEQRALEVQEWIDTDGDCRSMTILDGTGRYVLPALQAALPGRQVRLFEYRVPEVDGAVQRVYWETSALSRAALFGTSGRTTRLARDADGALAGVLLRVAALMDERSGSVGLVTHKPLARLLHRALDALALAPGEREAFARRARCGRTMEALAHSRARGDLVKERVLWFGGQRGSNALATCRVVAVLGDPVPNVGAVREDARTLGLGDEYIDMLLHAEVAQALGRGREVRRTLDTPLTLVYAGRSRPACWDDVQYVTAGARAGGPTPKFAGLLAEEVARRMIARWGVASASLARLCAEVPAVAQALEAATHLRAHDVGPSGGTITPSDLALVMALPPRSHEDAVVRALGGLGVAVRTNPSGRGGRWRLFEREAGAADRAIPVILRALSR